jgi:hypothetical protein
VSQSSKFPLIASLLETSVQVPGMGRVKRITKLPNLIGISLGRDAASGPPQGGDQPGRVIQSPRGLTLNDEKSFGGRLLEVQAIHRTTAQQEKCPKGVSVFDCDCIRLATNAVQG